MSEQRAGWLTTSKSKPVMIDALEESLRKGEVKLASETLFNELMIYSYSDDGTTGAQDGFFDDLATALAIAWAIRDEAMAIPPPYIPDEDYCFGRPDGHKRHRGW